jgi:hypothetical protein
MNSGEDPVSSTTVLKSQGFNNTLDQAVSTKQKSSKLERHLKVFTELLCSIAICICLSMISTFVSDQGTGL